MANKMETVLRAMLGTYFPWILLILAVLTTYYLVEQGNPLWPSLLKALVFYMGGIQGLWVAIALLAIPLPQHNKLVGNRMAFKPKWDLQISRLDPVCYLLTGQIRILFL